MNAFLTEIMSSIQGEGTKIGYRQIFIRFSRCNLKCNYCDTKGSLKEPELCIIEEIPGTKLFIHENNPLGIQKVIALLSQYNMDLHHSISLTGGEPLLNSDFIKELIPVIIEKIPKIKFFLETNGTLTDNLKKIINLIDIISMDFKIPSTSCLDPLWDIHREFLQVARAKEVYVKIVISEKTSIKEIETAAALINEFDKNIPLILQPATAKNIQKELLITPEKIFILQEIALKYLSEVRVIPQTHIFLGML